MRRFVFIYGESPRFRYIAYNAKGGNDEYLEHFIPVDVDRVKLDYRLEHGHRVRMVRGDIHRHDYAVNYSS